jgi:AraC-like DNA-binding protein
MWQRAPAAPLRGLVIELWAGLEPKSSARHRVLPNGEVALMLHLGSEQRLIEHDGARPDRLLQRGFVSGLQEQPATYEARAAMSVVTARLTPLGAWTLLGGLPQAELAGRVIELDSVLPSRAGLGALRERIGETRDLGAALDLLEEWLLVRCLRAPQPHAATHTAHALLLTAAEPIPIAALARECGVSARRLHELFLREVGLPAKRLSRVLRFRRTLDRLASARQRDLRDLALACGYYDQSHLYRDFRALAHMTPLEYLARLGEALDGTDVLAG